MSIARKSRRAAKHVTPILLLCTLAGCSAPAKVRDAPTVAKPTPAPSQQVEGALHEVLTSKAWQRYNARDYERAIDPATECVEEFGQEAARIQVRLEKDGVEVPLVGKPPSERHKAEVFENGVLNDVGTCYYIIGRCNEYLGRTDQALSAYAAARKLAYARCWDPKGWFWDPAQGSADRASRLAP